MKKLNGSKTSTNKIPVWNGAQYHRGTKNLSNPLLQTDRGRSNTRL